MCSSASRTQLYSVTSGVPESRPQCHSDDRFPCKFSKELSTTNLAGRAKSSWTITLLNTFLRLMLPAHKKKHPTHYRDDTDRTRKRLQHFAFCLASTFAASFFEPLTFFRLSIRLLFFHRRHKATYRKPNWIFSTASNESDWFSSQHLGRPTEAPKFVVSDVQKLNPEHTLENGHSRNSNLKC